MKDLKANGKNFIMVKVISDEYMDAYPSYGLRTFKDWETAKAWEKHMNDNYSGGTTKIEELTPEQLFAERQSPYWKGYEYAIDNAAQDCDQNFVDCYINELSHYYNH